MNTVMCRSTVSYIDGEKVRAFPEGASVALLIIEEEHREIRANDACVLEEKFAALRLDPHF